MITLGTSTIFIQSDRFIQNFIWFAHYFCIPVNWFYHMSNTLKTYHQKVLKHQIYHLNRAHDMSFQEAL